MRTISFMGPFVALIGLYKFIAFRPELRGYQFVFLIYNFFRPDNLDYVMKKSGNRL